MYAYFAKTPVNKPADFIPISTAMSIPSDLQFLNINNPFTNERMSVYLDKHRHMSLDRKDYFVKQISHLSKGVVIVASAVNYSRLVQ